MTTTSIPSNNAINFAKNHTNVLPPDPEGDNDKRAGRGGFLIEQYQRKSHCDRVDALSDLLADLMHWCDRNEFSFDKSLTSAERHYTEETLPLEEYCNCSEPISRGAKALAAAQQAAATLQWEKKQNIAKSLELLHQIAADDFVWALVYDKSFDYSQDDVLAEHIRLLLNIFDGGCKGSTLNEKAPELTDLEQVRFQGIKQAIDILDQRLKSSGLPYILVSGFKQQLFNLRVGKYAPPEAMQLLVNSLTAELCLRLGVKN